MTARALGLAALIVLLNGMSADARDPFDDDRGIVVPGAAHDPLPFAVPAGLYYVTDTYVGSVVTTTGATTTYSTTTVHESTGTYARVIDTVDTGASSAFDGLAFNGRGSLTDGRALAGTYYENFVLTADGYAAVSIVFFQDDSETRRQTVRSSASPGPTLPPTPSATSPAATPAPASSSAHARALATPTPAPGPMIPVANSRPTLRAGVALAPDGPVLASAEVLRGRLVEFWPRAFANDVAIPVGSWRLISAAPDWISASSGTGQPFASQWTQMPAPGVAWILQFEVFSEVAPSERLETQIAVYVRSPALID